MRAYSFAIVPHYSDAAAMCGLGTLACPRVSTIIAAGHCTLTRRLPSGEQTNDYTTAVAVQLYYHAKIKKTIVDQAEAAASLQPTLLPPPFAAHAHAVVDRYFVDRSSAGLVFFFSPISPHAYRRATPRRRILRRRRAPLSYWSRLPPITQQRIIINTRRV